MDARNEGNGEEEDEDEDEEGGRRGVGRRAVRFSLMF